MQQAGLQGVEQQQLLQPEPGHRVDTSQQQQQAGLWSSQGFKHPGLQAHQLQQLQQQQLQQQLLLGGQHSLAPLVGQQISQLLGPGQTAAQHQSPPGLGPMMLGHHGPGPAGVSMAHALFPGQPVQSPPSSSGQFLLLPGTAHQPHRAQQQQQQQEAAALSPNSTPGLQTPTPSATPPINFDSRDPAGLFLGAGRMMSGLEPEQVGEMEAGLAWRGLQAGLQGGTLAEMMGPGMERSMGGQFGGLERQLGLDRGMGPHGYPGLPASGPHGFNGFNMAAMQGLQAQAQAAQAAQAQENMMRLQQLQQQSQQEFLQSGGPKQLLPGLPGQFQPGGPAQLLQSDLTRHFPGFPPPQCQSPSPNGFGIPPGPRPRPVGGDSSPPGFSADSLPAALVEPEQPGPTKEPQQPQQQLVIGSWNEECEKEPVAGATHHSQPPPLPHNLSQPPPRFPPQQQPDHEWGGTFHVPRPGGPGGWGGQQDFPAPDTKPGPPKQEFHTVPPGGEGGRGKRGGRGGGRGGPGGRGRGGAHPPSQQHVRSDPADIQRERVQGKSAAIEETKAMMAKMRLEDQEMMSKYRKDKGMPDKDIGEENKVQPGAYRPRERRGRDDRKDGQRGVSTCLFKFSGLSGTYRH